MCVLRAVFVVLSYIEGNKSSAYMQGWFGDGILIEVFENSIEGLRYSIFCVSLESYKLLSFTEKQLKKLWVFSFFNQIDSHQNKLFSCQAKRLSDKDTRRT